MNSWSEGEVLIPVIRWIKRGPRFMPLFLGV